MWQSVLKKVGFPSEEDYIRPRLSIGNAVYDQPFSTGHFTIQVDAQALSVVIKNPKGRIIWKSIQNCPFLASSVGHYKIVPGDKSGVFHVSEQEATVTRLQTITRIERIDNSTVKIYGGLGSKMVLPTHMDYVFVLKEVSNRQLEFSAEILKRDDSMRDYTKLMLIYESRPEEKFYGFGEQFSFISLKGQKVPILVREQWSGRGITSAFSFNEASLGAFSYISTADSLATQASIPQYITSDIRSILMENTEYMSFDLTEPNRVVVRLDSDKIKGRILDGKTMLDLLTEYTSYTGRMVPLPDWASSGVIAGIQGGRDKIKQIISRLSEYNVPLSAIYICDWTGQRTKEVKKGTAILQSWWNWESDDDLYPDWPSFVDCLNKQGIRVIAYINPFFNNMKEKQSCKRNLYKEADENGYLVKKAKPLSPDDQVLLLDLPLDIEAGLLDLTNPGARVWFKQILQQIWDTNISGMMIDCGEHFPYDNEECVLFSGESASGYHNKYPVEWANLHREAMKENNKNEDFMCSFESAYTNSPKSMNLFWTGNRNVTWDQHYGMKSAVIGMLSGGFSGISVTHCDAGGYNSALSNIPGLKMARTRELLFRWLELAALTPVFRTSEGIAPSMNAQFYDDEESYLHLAHTAKLFVFLSAYRKTVLAEAYKHGWPVLRHPVLYYPTDKVAQELTYQQFFIGSCVMAAPVMTPSTTYVKVYFPKDAQEIKWRHIWSGKLFTSDGTYKSVDAPIGQPAIFIKEPRDDDGLLNSLLNYAATYSHYNIT